MTLLQLTYYCEVYRTRSFTRAAENLHMTQPAITNSIRELENEFHLQFLERSGKKLIITEAGEELYEMAMKLLDYAEQIQLVMQDKANEKHRLLLGAPNMTYAAFFPQLFHEIHKTWTDMEIQCTHNLTAALLPQLESGKLHMLLIPYLPEGAQYRSLVLGRTGFVFCVPKNHRLADRAKLTYADICHEPLISFFGDVFLHNFDIARHYREQGAEMNVVYRCDQINVMHDLIRAGEGCGFLLRGSFSGEGIVGIPLEEELIAPVYLVWTRESERHQVVQKVLSCIRKRLDKEGPVLL